MDDSNDTPHLPLTILIVGLLLVLGCCIWSGVLFFFYSGSILYGVIACICLGATYSFIKQIRAQLFSREK